MGRSLESETLGEVEEPVVIQSSRSKRVLIFAAGGTKEEHTGWYMVDVPPFSSFSEEDKETIMMMKMKMKMKMKARRKRSYEDTESEEEEDDSESEEEKEDDDKVKEKEKEKKKEDVASSSLSASESGISYLAPVNMSSSRYFSAYCRVGSTLYRVGGHFTRDVVVADIEESLLVGEWKGDVFPSMLAKRRGLEVVAVDEKLYVFGGLHAYIEWSPPVPWAEVYDPILKKWTPLSKPPVELDLFELFAVYDPDSSSSSFKSKIILGAPSSNSVLSYDIVSDTWEIIADNFSIFTNSSHPVLYKDILYWIGKGVSVYDLNLKRQYSVPLFGFYGDPLIDFPGELDYTPPLLHIDGDEFCYIWLRHNRLNEVMHSTICCTTIRISMRHGKNGGIKSGKGRCLFTKHYPVNHEIGLLDAVLM